MDTPGLNSAAQRHELSSIAGTYAANTNRIALARPIRRVRLYLASSANNQVFMHAANAEDASPATELAAVGSRYRFIGEALANGGSVVDICFNFDVKFLYFLTSAGTCDAHVIGWEL